jgi:GTP pyrophosphokinase
MMVRDLTDFMDQVHSQFKPEEQELISRAAQCAENLHQGQTRASGEPYFIHPLQVAAILLEMHMDATTLAAALLHDTLEDTTLTREELRTRFGAEVESLVFGVTKIDIANAQNKSTAETETIRKMLFAMITDIRVILIKLADKLHNMRTLQFKTPERQKAIAQDTLDLYAPLAARLGISGMKDELEDLSLKFLQPDVYQQIKAYVAQKKNERAQYLTRVSDAIHQAAKAENIDIGVESRAKHFYSIYQKMKERNKKLEEIYDMLGIRVMCESLHECYILLGLVHRLWMPIEGRFKDYIAMPKANRYQSLHTTVMCYDGKLIEIQIRTRDMDETAEFGVAAHWLYKQKTSGGVAPETSDLSIINRLRDLNAESLATSDFLEEIKREILRDSIYVFTPQGDVIQMAKGATAIDFAYHIHTEIGNHAAAAKADGVIIPLKAPLKNTQVIEVITSPHARPHVDWLRYVKSARTRHKIRAWLNKHDDNLFIDRNIVARKPKEMPPTERITRHKSQPAGDFIEGQAGPPRAEQVAKRQAIRVGEERNMMIHFANCCTPVTGDDIIGYVSRGRGIIIHRRDCNNILHIPDLSERSIEVEWESVSPRIKRIISIDAHKNSGLFGQIEAAIKRHHGHLASGKLEDNNNGHLEGRFIIDLPRREDFKKVLKDLRQIKSVVQLNDITDTGTEAELS